MLRRAGDHSHDWENALRNYKTEIVRNGFRAAAMNEHLRGRVVRIIATGMVSWIVAFILPICLLYYLEYGPEFINIVLILTIIYFIIIPAGMVMLLIYDLISSVRYGQVRFINRAWYLVLLVFASLSILIAGITYGVLSQNRVVDPL